MPPRNTLNLAATGGNQNNNYSRGSQYVGTHQYFFVVGSLGKFPEQEEQKCLQSLCFLEMDYRQNNIHQAYQNTCEWLFETTEFLQWRGRDNGVLWIKGKPGAGKSTLMKHTFERFSQQKSEHHIVASFFFNGRGTVLEKTTLGMLRAIIYQIIEQDQDIYELFLALYCEKSRKAQNGKDWEWNESELERFLREDLLNSPVIQRKSKSLYFFIDAPDECGKTEFRNIVYLLEALKTKNVNLSICLASRHYPNIEMEESLNLIMENENGHKTDIETYTTAHLRGRTPEIGRKIGEKASGIFMWVHLVLDRLRQAYDDGEANTSALFQIVQGLPTDLEKVFQEMLQVDSPQRQETTYMLQLVLFSMQPLTPSELYFATTSMSTEFSESPRDQNRSTVSEDTISRYITKTSKGLIEIRGEGRKTAQLIHESAREFLLNDGLKTLNPDLGENVAGKGHNFLKHCCMKSVDSSKQLQHLDTGTMLLQLPFLGYASKYILHHAEKARLTGIPQHDILKFLASGKNLETLTDYRSALQCLALAPSVQILSMFAYNESREIPRIAVYCGDIVAINDRETYSKALQVALIHGHAEIVTILGERMATNEVTESSLILIYQKAVSHVVSFLSCNYHVFTILALFLYFCVGSVK